jgi:hypothetical protein
MGSVGAAAARPPKEPTRNTNEVMELNNMLCSEVFVWRLKKINARMRR